MRNKKYRLWKLLLLLAGITLVCLLSGLLLFDGFEKIFALSGSGICFLVLILYTTLYFEVQADRIIVRQGVFSRNKAYESSFRKRVFMFEDINDITVEGKKIVWVKLKDGNSVSFDINGCFCKNKIIGLIYEVRAQIKGYEQQYVNKN